MQPIPNNVIPSRKRVLIAEDNEDISFIFTFALKHDYDVQTAANGREALAIIESASPDLLVLDINMPEVSGIGVLNALRERKLEHPMKIIVATGNTIAANDPIMEYADMTLLKPISPSQLALLAERLLS